MRLPTTGNQQAYGTIDSRHEVILVADDDQAVRGLVCQALVEEGYRTVEVRDGEAALEALTASDGRDVDDPDRIALALLDILMPELDGLEVLKARAGAIGFPGDTVVVMLTAMGHSDRVVRATQLGAADYLCKPFDLDELLELVRRVLDERWQQQHAPRYDLSGLRAATGTAHIIGTSRAMIQVFRLIGMAARSTSPVLITGETGTGKELVAATIHWGSPRAQKPYMVRNCAAIPESLLESELFGANKGSYTDRRTDHAGLFEQADGGTFFLDEIAEMSGGMQAKVLRVLETGVVQRLGAERGQEIHVDVRLIAATNRDLAMERALQHFRDDLFHRLHVVPIHLPPLRERTEDIPALVAYFLEKHRGRVAAGGGGSDGGSDGSRTPGATAAPRPAEITQDAVDLLMSYSWPGNVRELEHVIIAALLRSRGRLITPAHIELGDNADEPSALLDVRARIRAGTPLSELEDDVRQLAYRAALETEHGDVARAAARLRIPAGRLRTAASIAHVSSAHARRNESSGSAPWNSTQRIHELPDVSAARRRWALYRAVG